MSAPFPSPDLIDALKEGRAIAIVGSGLSSQVGGPSWEDLLYGMVAEACETRPEEADKIRAAFLEIRGNRFLSGAGILKQVLGPGFAKSVVRQIEFKRELKPRAEIKETEKILDALFETCGRSEKRELVPSISHRMLMQLPFRAIITTNYDRLLEEAAISKKRSSVFTRSYPYLPKRVQDAKWFLLKIHGCIGTPEDIILSRDDYRKTLFGEPIREVLESLFKTNEKFWIGYGHNDPTLDFLVDECLEKLHLNGGFAVAKKTNYVLENRFTTADILPSWVDDHSQIPDYLRKLAEATDSPLIFEITIKCEWTGDRDAVSYGKRIAEAFSRLGGDYDLFRVEMGSIRLYLETKASNLAGLRNRLAESDPEILKIIKSFNIASFDGLNVENLIYNGNIDEVDSSTSIQADVSESKHHFPVPNQIPPPPADFKGREDEIKDILANFEKGATITGLRGMGGIGKTALALVLAEKLKDQFPDGQIFIDMRGTSVNPALPPVTPVEAMAQVIRAYKPVERLPENPVELHGLYLSVLTGKHTLLLLDNAVNSEQVVYLLPPAGCSVLITSRIKFTLLGLVEKDLDVLPSDKACELLIETAPRIGNRAEELAKLCGYLPIALRNAARALAEKRDLGVPEYEKRLRDKVARLELVKASFSLSYELLTPGRKKQWRRLSVFPEDFDGKAAIAVLKMAPGPSAEALSDLVRWSLVDFIPFSDSEGGRYRLHDLARLFAESCLEPDELIDVQQKHSKHYLKVLSEADKLYEKGEENLLTGLKLFDREWANIKVGQAWTKTMVRISKRLKKSDMKFVLQMANSYPNDGAYVLGLRLHSRDMISWLETGLKATRIMGRRSAEGPHLGNLGSAYYYLGDYRKAIEYYGQALAISREIKDRQNEGNDLGNLGVAYYDLGETRKAIEYYGQALAINREIGNRRSEGANLGNLGLAYSRLGDYRKAIEYHELAFVISREIGDRRNEGTQLGNLGVVYYDLGETRKAIEYYEQALAITREIGDRRGEGDRLGNLGNAYHDLGETRKAIKYYEQALAIGREIEDLTTEGENLCNLGKAYSDLNEADKAIECYMQSLDIVRKIEYRKVEGEALYNLGKVYVDLGENKKAIDYCDQALEIFQKMEYRSGEADALFNKSLALDNLGQRQKAIDGAKAALDIFEQIESPRAEKARRKLAEWQSSSPPEN